MLQLRPNGYPKTLSLRCRYLSIFIDDIPITIVDKSVSGLLKNRRNNFSKIFSMCSRLFINISGKLLRKIISKILKYIFLAMFPKFIVKAFNNSFVFSNCFRIFLKLFLNFFQREIISKSLRILSIFLQSFPEFLKKFLIILAQSFTNYCENSLKFS